MARKPTRCPECSATTVVRIMYGLPDNLAMKAAERAEIALGGCVISDDDPRWACTTCDATFGRR